VSSLEQLPTVAHVQAAQQDAAVLTFTDDSRAFLVSAGLPHLCFQTLPDGSGVLLEDWKSGSAPAYRVPAHLCAAVCAALGLRTVAEEASDPRR
jgi:hypothetical protein